MLLALSAYACLREGDAAPPPSALLPVMAAAELLHTATLLHDDVLDAADVRRGLQTARVLWGNSAALSR
ncbi:MAG TPA: polyprenyl synthetase family protein [Polyangiaceae bacterium]|nr:polyprenyl synthetase family protein [Polyangiaceae bacterium]